MNPGYIEDYLGYSRTDDNYEEIVLGMEKNVQDLRFIQDSAGSRPGKTSFVFYTPSKTDFTEEGIYRKVIKKMHLRQTGSGIVMYCYSYLINTVYDI